MYAKIDSLMINLIKYQLYYLGYLDRHMMYWQMIKSGDNMIMIINFGAVQRRIRRVNMMVIMLDIEVINKNKLEIKMMKILLWLMISISKKINLMPNLKEGLILILTWVLLWNKRLWELRKKLVIRSNVCVIHVQI